MLVLFFCTYCSLWNFGFLLRFDVADLPRKRNYFVPVKSSIIIDFLSQFEHEIC
jgi:hypothetical protein